MNTEDQTPNKYPRYDEAFKRVAKLMRQAGISHRPQRRFRRMSLTARNPSLARRPNRLRAQTQSTPPDAVWLVTGAS